MDTDDSLPRRSADTQGGTVEPADRAAVAKERFQAPIDAAGERYQLRDPFAEVTYRTSSFAEMTAKADRLGSDRFIALDAEGKRTTVKKIDGQWLQAPRPDDPERSKSSTSTRDDAPKVRNSAPAPKTSSRDDISDTRTVVRIEAKAERAALVAQLEATLAERYQIKRARVILGEMTVGRTEYRFRGDTSRVAFTESTFRLATDTNSPSVARSMVDVAQARNWRGLRVSGNDDFKRMVWLEASVRGVKTIGYEASLADVSLLKKEREARLVNRIEPDRDAGRGPGPASAPAEIASSRGGGRKAVLAAIEAVLIAKGVPENRREAVMIAASERLAQRVRAGQSVKVKVYNNAAPSQRPVSAVKPDVQRTQERATPAR